MRRTATLLAAALTLGCGGQPQVAGDNIDLLRSLVTAVGAKRADWVEAHAAKVEQGFADETVTAAEKAAFAPIHAAAGAGDWEEAQRLVRDLAAGQRLDRVTDQTPRKPERREPPARP